MMFKVLFRQNETYKDHKRILPYQQQKEQFSSVYPGIYQAVYTLKKKDYTRLSIFLQRIEAKIFIDTICPALVNNGVTPLTIHDSIIVDAQHKSKALEVCEDAFNNQFGVIPSFHVEPLKPQKP